MKLRQALVISLAGVLVLAGAGCKKKKPPVPAHSQPPTINPSPTPPVVDQPPPQPTPPVAEAPAPTPEPKPEPRPKKSRRTAKKPAAGTPAPAKTPATEEKPAPASQGDTTNVQITADVPANAATQRKQQIENILQATESDLKRISRPLSDSEQAMQRQARNFITQARLAMSDGDLERSYNLATKAHLISQELVK